MSSAPPDLPTVQAQAAGFLKQAQEIRNIGFQAYQQTQLLIRKLNTSQVSLKNIRPLFVEHIQDVNNLVNDIISRQVLGREVERILEEQRQSLADYKASLEMLQQKQLHPALRHIAPSDAAPVVSETLAAWANLQQLEKLESEALQELEELENLVSWTKTTVDAIKIKHAQVSTTGSEVLDIISGDARIPNEAELLQEQNANCAALEDLLSDIKLHNERALNFLGTSGGALDAGQQLLASSRVATLVVLAQTSETIPLKIQQMQNRCNKVTAIKNDVQDKATKHSQLFTKCSSVTQSLSTFGQECQAIFSELEFLRGEFEVYRANLPTNVFSVLTTTSAAWKRFAFAYDEMVIELSRRRAQLFRTQEIVDAYQRELDLLHQQEQKEHRRFEELYMKDFPQSWLNTVPGLLEPPIKYKIYPERFATAIPDFSGHATPNLQHSNSAERQSSSSSSTLLATSSTTTPPPALDGPAASALLSSSVGPGAGPHGDTRTPKESLYRSAQEWNPESTVLSSIAFPAVGTSALDQSQIPQT